MMLTTLEKPSNTTLLTSTTGPMLQVSFPGPQGKSGSASVTYPCVSPIAIGGHRLVRFSSVIQILELADVPGALFLTGITVHAAGVGDPLDILLHGPITEPSWAFTPGPVYATDNGLLTQTVPTQGVLLCVGSALDATTLFFCPRIPLVLSE